MTVQIGLVISGDDEANVLSVTIVNETDGSKSVYNVIEAGAGNDKLFGVDEAGDTLPYGVQLYGEDGNDTFWDSTNTDTLIGGSGNDTFHYAGGADTINGGGGFDTLSFLDALPVKRISLDNLTLSGIDSLVVYDGLDVGHFNLNSLDKIQAHDWASETTLVFTQKARLFDVEFVGAGTQWIITGSNFNDHLDFSTDRITSEINGGRGNDVIKGGNLRGVIYGEIGNDALTGGNARDYIDGGDGGDMISGAGGADDLYGDTGNDRIYGGEGNDSIVGGDGNDTIYGGEGDDGISSGEGKSFVDGGDGDDNIFVSARERPYTQTLKGGDGNDTFEVSKFKIVAPSTLHGGEGLDTISIRNGDLSNLTIKDVEILDLSWTSRVTIGAGSLSEFEHIVGVNGSKMSITLSSGGRFIWEKALAKPEWVDFEGSSQADQLDFNHAMTGFWTVNGGNGDDVIIGPSANRYGGEVLGGSGNDILKGGNGGGSLFGDKGNDILYAGTRGSVLTGGAGNDKLVGGIRTDDFSCGGGGSDTIVIGQNSGYDYIREFSGSGPGHDIIDLSVVSSIQSFRDLIENHVQEFDDNILGGTKTVIELGGNDKLTLFGVAIADLHETSFLF